MKLLLFILIVVAGGWVWYEFMGPLSENEKGTMISACAAQMPGGQDYCACFWNEAAQSTSRAALRKYQSGTNADKDAFTIRLVRAAGIPCYEKTGYINNRCMTEPKLQAAPAGMRDKYCTCIAQRVRTMLPGLVDSAESMVKGRNVRYAAAFDAALAGQINKLHWQCVGTAIR